MRSRESFRESLTDNLKESLREGFLKEHMRERFLERMVCDGELEEPWPIRALGFWSLDTRCSEYRKYSIKLTWYTRNNVRSS